MKEIVPTHFRDTLSHLREDIDEAFDRWIHPARWRAGNGEKEALPAFFSSGMPSVDIEDDENEVLVTAELPGLDKKDFKVEVNEDSVTIRGEKKTDREEKKKNYYYAERSYGSFSRTIPLPWHIDPEKTEARYRNGILKVRLPKTEQEKARRIDVKVA